jgi:hypothetical protein
MAFDPFKKITPPAITLEERVAIEQGIYPDAGNS